MSDSDVIKVDSIEQAEKIILEHINSGENYRDIAQITFDVNGTVKRFNPSQISKIKAKYEQNQAQNTRDPDKSRCFKLFRKGKSPVDVVIETGLSYEYVKKAHKEFLESEDKVMIPAWFYEDVRFLAGYPGYSQTLENATKVMYELIESDQVIQSIFSNCTVCGNSWDWEVDEPLKVAKKNLRVAWHHEKCS